MEPDGPSAEKAIAYEYLASLLNKNLRIHTTDGRMFRGRFTCTDPVGLGRYPGIWTRLRC